MCLFLTNLANRDNLTYVSHWGTVSKYTNTMLIGPTVKKSFVFYYKQRKRKNTENLVYHIKFSVYETKLQSANR